VRFRPAQILESGGDPGHAGAQIARGLKLGFDRLARAVRAGQRGRPVGRAADPVGDQYLRVLAVWGAHEDHSEVQQRHERGQDGGFLAVLRHWAEARHPEVLAAMAAYDRRTSREYRLSERNAS